ncbi:MAG: ftsY [Rickettsiaceae bacterium]|jgi:fused signal recognition particle receptor|nr:ftsY [Rickettsiaceae bacterium]
MTNQSWLQRFKSAFSKTSQKISSSLSSIFLNKKIDKGTLEELEESLLSADLGMSCTEKIINTLQKAKLESTDDVNLLQDKLVEIIEDKLSTPNLNFKLKENSLNVIMVCGVNGNGKTTSIGKLAYQFKSQGKKVLLAACDTFRAAAIEQLEVWGQRAGCEVIAGAQGADPASVAYKALETAKNLSVDILFIDTAGRLHNQKNLMDELAKIVRVIKKVDETAPHHTLMVLDGTTGQNAYTQLESFKACTDISGLIVTKLDGTSKAGVLVGLVDKFKLPVYFIGIGEQIDDLKKFDAKTFAKSILGI